MSTHSITSSVISLANPWLDFLPAPEGPGWAARVNDELSDMCVSCRGGGGGGDGKDPLYAFATLPLSASPDAVVREVDRLAKLPRVVGAILGTAGLGGAGLDDPALETTWAALQATSLMIFLHPHHGLPPSVFGPRSGEYGHVLPLALGFPMETTIAFTRMYSSGVFDRFPALRVLLAHAGGTLCLLFPGGLAAV